MSADGFFADSATNLIEALLNALREDDALKSALGDPVRLFDDESQQPHYPYAVLERSETTDTSSSLVSSFEHNLQFATFSRYGGLREAKALLGSLRDTLERVVPVLTQQRIILIIPTYCDVMRTQNQQVFRGVLRVRIHTEEI
ncbi:MAG: DUF3168 domain-containing protein [Henriciella sp.]